MNFTPAQKTAIDTKNCSLLVAAGAGSGKTRVLTERIIDRLLSDDTSTDITKYLIVTFTNAAAKELSDRIRTALTQKSAEFPDNKKITRNLALLPQAKICTIDSFCYDIVKDNFQRLGLPPKLRIAEETETDVILSRIVGDIVEEKMSADSGSEYFLTFYELFAGAKSGDNFEKTVIHLYKSLLNLPSVETFLTESCEKYKESAECNEFFDSYYGKLIQNIAKNTAQKALDGIERTTEKCKSNPEVYEKFESVFENESEFAKILLNSINSSFDDAAYCLQNLKFKTYRPSSYPDPEFASEIYEKLKLSRELIKELRDSYFSVTSDTLKKCADDYYNVLCEIKDIILEADSRFAKAKKNFGILNFSDVERMTLGLLYDDINLGTTSDIAHALSAEFEELYIDEYQDINPVQDMIFRAISRTAYGGFECNRFMVGDSKQSIYGFRGARPEIFNTYRRDFDDAEETSAPRRKLFMQNNFRCAENVIDFTNMLFDKIMPDEYTEDDKLIYSRVEQVKADEPVKLMLCNADELSDRSAEARLTVQADVVLDEIKKVVNRYDVTDSSGKPYSLNDVAILVQTWDEARFLEKYFSSQSIPVVCEKGENFFDRPEITLVLCILCSVDNPERDVYTAGFMRSSAGGFDDDELTEIRLHHRDGSFFMALNEYASCGNNEEIKAKANRFLELHKTLRSMSRCNSASEFVRKMYVQTDLINVCTSESFGVFASHSASIRKKNLMRFYDMAREYDKTVFKGLSSFIEYIETKISGSDTKSATDAAEDAGIRVMTIHKSKGLEFPICFVFGMDKKKRHSSDSLVMNEKSGLSFKLKTLEKLKGVGGKKGFASVDTPFRQLFLELNDTNEHIESKRLLYVALTRAKDRLYITACPDKFEQLIDSVNSNFEEYMTDGKSHLDKILGFLAQHSGIQQLKNSGTYHYVNESGKTVLDAKVIVCNDVDADCESENTEKQAEVVYAPDADLLEKLKQQIVTRKAAVSSIVSVPPKLTVSLLKQGLLDYEDASLASSVQRKPLEKPEFVKEDVAQSAAEKGTAMHMFMQFADFSRCENGNCVYEADRLYEDGFITEKQREMLDISRLDSFFETDLYKSIRNAVNVYRELRFNLKVPASEVIANIPSTDDFVLVQGVIDCFIENSDGTYTVIDFKTDRVDKETGAVLLKERYSGQLALYCKAVEDITKKKVSKSVIFSFALMEEIIVER